VKGINVEVNIKTIYGAFDKIRHLDIRKVFSDLRGPVRFDQRHHWRKEEAPSRHWQGLAPSTLERRKRPRGIDRKRGKRLSWPTRLLGRFPTALQMIASTRELIARSRVKRFSLIHQEGGVAGHGSVIPSRQYLWISPFLIGQIRTYFEKALARQAAKT
jgi:phage gpG-like protein